jgi:hypothetical protein
MRSGQSWGGREVAIIALVLFIIAAAANTNIFPILMLAGAIYALARIYDQQRAEQNTTTSRQSRRSSRPQYRPPEAVTRPVSADTVYRHALDAAKAAGLDPNEDLKVLPVDIGLVAFRGSEDPTPYRTHPIPDDVDYVQPFVQLRLPMRANGRIRFEITDADGQVLFIHEDLHQLERGRNLITPAARLPIHDAQAMHGAWEMRVTADGVPLAVHRFEWEEDDTNLIRRHLAEDGEISNELRSMLAENRLQQMSLDELLSDQGEDDQQAQQRK